MSGIKIILYGMSALLLAGCGQIVTESVSVPQAVPSTACAVNRKVVILPFADYSYADDMNAASQRNMAITEALTDELVARGFAVPVQEDTLRYLVAQNVIKSIDAELSARTISVRNEMQANWSDVMKDELRGMLALEERQAADAGNTEKTPGTHGLDSKMINQIGRDFAARFVLRGRIIKYGMEKENTWEPMKKGLLPFVVDTATQVFYGFAKTDGYDTLGAMSLGYATGAMLGDSASNPYTLADRIDPSAANSVVWGAAGAGVAYLAKQGGETNQAAVQLRVWVQNAESGEVVWTNRVDVKVAPQSVFADNNPDSLFQTAVNRAVAALIADFWAKNELYL